MYRQLAGSSGDTPFRYRRTSAMINLRDIVRTLRAARCARPRMTPRRRRASPSVPGRAPDRAGAPRTTIPGGPPRGHVASRDCAGRSCARTAVRSRRIGDGGWGMERRIHRQGRCEPACRSGEFGGFRSRVRCAPRSENAHQPKPEREPAAYRPRRLRNSESLTVSRRRPFLRRRARTLRPAFVFMRARKPWSLTRFRFVGL